MKRLLIWGTGDTARQFIDNEYNGEIIGFIETDKSCSTFMDKPVYGGHEIPDEYDYIIVANTHTAEIYDFCFKLHMDLSHIIFLCHVKKRMGCIDQAVLKGILAEKNYTSYCREYNLMNDSFFREDLTAYQKLNRRPSFRVQEKYTWPVISDKYALAGTINNYFFQDLWAARLVAASGVTEHFDIGSRLDGFIAHVLAAGIKVTMIDIREFPGEVENLHTIVDDATSLGQIPDDSIDSMSALCSLEHFGLGRYGDPIDPEACFKCFDNIQRKLKKDGRFYLSVPVGKERVEFNAHRVFYAGTIVDCFHALELKEFSCVAEGGIEYNADIHKYDMDEHNGEWRYGLFYFKK